jgi:hypothetical protein
MIFLKARGSWEPVLCIWITFRDLWKILNNIYRATILFPIEAYIQLLNAVMAIFDWCPLHNSVFEKDNAMI